MATCALPGIYFSSKEYFDQIKDTDTYQTVISLVDVELPKEHSFKHYQLTVHSWGEIKENISTIIPILKGASDENKVLIHCQMGCNRCTLCIMAYMVAELDYTPQGAYEALQKKNPCVGKPIFHFLEAIIDSVDLKLGKEGRDSHSKYKADDAIDSKESSKEDNVVDGDEYREKNFPKSRHRSPNDYKTQ